MSQVINESSLFQEEFIKARYSRTMSNYQTTVEFLRMLNLVAVDDEATIIIKLDDEKDFSENRVNMRIKNIILDRTNELAFNLLKKMIIHYRRVEEDYYNFGVIKPPMNLEDFNRNTHITIFQKGMFLKEATIYLLVYLLFY